MTPLIPPAGAAYANVGRMKQDRQRIRHLSFARLFPKLTLLRNVERRISNETRRAVDQLRLKVGMADYTIGYGALNVASFVVVPLNAGVASWARIWREERKGIANAARLTIGTSCFIKAPN
jgi:hypothetical protein